jgi:hypothetical protein
MYSPDFAYYVQVFWQINNSERESGKWEGKKDKTYKEDTEK